jgi:hypothetical protein
LVFCSTLDDDGIITTYLLGLFSKTFLCNGRNFLDLTFVKAFIWFSSVVSLNKGGDTATVELSLNDCS